MSVTIDPASPDGFLVNSFAGDDWRDCRDHIKDRLGICRGDYVSKPRLVHSRDDNPAPVIPDVDKSAIALSTWEHCVPIGGTLAEQYLKSRGCALDVLPDDLRFSPALWYDGGSAPGMVALMRDIRTNARVGIHRTFLKPDGTKLDRRMLGPAKGACVKLTQDADVTYGLGIAEGIETSLSIMKAGFSPIWACLSAGTIAEFPVLNGIESLTIFADNDESGTGQASAVRCMVRWKNAGLDARGLMPKTHGDFNDGMTK